MRVENCLKTRMALYSKARDFCVGKGVTMYVDELSDAMVLFLAEQYEFYEKSGKTCLKGDIASLYARKAEICQRRLYDTMTYREYLQLMYGDKPKNSK